MIPMNVTINPAVAIIYLLSIPVGFCLVGTLIWFMRWTAELSWPSFEITTFWVSTAERSVAMAKAPGSFLPEALVQISTINRSGIEVAMHAEAETPVVHVVQGAPTRTRDARAAANCNRG